MAIELRIDKAARVLVALDGPREVYRCRVALGRAPIGHKRAEGDGRTPEGKYAVCTRNDQSKYYRSLGLSYPGADDAARAFAEGRIAAEECERIQSAHCQGRRPPWDGPLGGFIMIHGGGTDGDWTQGCIAVDDRDIDALWALCPLGTMVTISP
ncbi:MAG: L,D-transpeptidase family protein [Clostridiales bacterium]|nr:L,D-transpeptidase family protein [Clostridiales bacterium]